MVQIGSDYQFTLIATTTVHVDAKNVQREQFTLCVKGFHLIPLPLLPLTVPVRHPKGRKQNASVGGSITLTNRKDYIYYSKYTECTQDWTQQPELTELSLSI